MTKQLLFCVLLGSLTACQPDSDIQPGTASLAGEIGGRYRTNVFLDPSCVALSSSQLPTVTLLAESDSAVSVLYAYQYPQKGTRRVEGVALSRQADSSVQLRVGNTTLGSVQTERVFTDNGMEKEGKLLRITYQNSATEIPYFAGVKE
ncbi:hypothetical protein GGR92_004697 [Spirosoma lacussanchae]|uniref:hypothetical protein n=1 Tax=Spirosoma lacussanchae TaxID=1884249 RepID=UPI0011081E46|nr:hypothetical protein [Spirosoma lacussanchae]